MKNYYLLILLILIGCTSKKKSENITPESKRDTILIDKVVFYLDSISEIEYFSAAKQKNVEFKGEIFDDTTSVSRDSLILKFHLKNGADSVIVDDTTEGWSNYVNYTYIGPCNFIDYWLIMVTFYEGGQYMLIDRENGNKIWICGIPIYSPNKKLFICNSCDLEAGYDFNGFQLFEIINNKSVLKWTKELNDWGPSEIRWKNDSTIYIEQTRMDFQKSESPYVKTYKSMILK